MPSSSLPSSPFPLIFLLLPGPHGIEALRLLHANYRWIFAVRVALAASQQLFSLYCLYSLSKNLRLLKYWSWPGYAYHGSVVAFCGSGDDLPCVWS